MAQLVYLIERVAPGLYFFCAALLLYWLRRLILAGRRLATAEFELERELAEQERASAITWTLLVIELALAVVAIAYVIAPTLRNDLLTAGMPVETRLGGTPPFETSTPGGSGSEAGSVFETVTAQALAGEGGSQILLTAVASPTPVGTIIPGYPTPVGCNTSEASLEVPGNGQKVFDTLTVIGTAHLPNFAFYKLELRGPSTGNEFAPILGDKTSPVMEKGVLGQIPLGPFQPGDYAFRLAVFDSTGELRASCMKWIIISPPEPTSTPPPAAP